MNFLAHAEVARRMGGASDATVLGAMLPDLAHLVPFGIVRSGLPAALAAGWDCHVASDSVFHADTRFRAAVSGMARRLRHGGWRQWPAHAAAHVSWELLLDGRWVLRSDPAGWFPAVVRSPTFLEHLQPDEARQWLQLADLRFATSLWAPYVDPEPVAERTWRRLRRTSVAFGADGIGQLADLLGEQVAVVEELAEPMVQAAAAAAAAASAAAVAAVANGPDAGTNLNARSLPLGGTPPTAPRP